MTRAAKTYWRRVQKKDGLIQRGNQMAEGKKEKERILKETISLEDYKKIVCDCRLYSAASYQALEDYKKKVFDCLIKYQNCSIREANNLMTDYEEDFPEFYEDNWPPEAAACGMVMRY